MRVTPTPLEGCFVIEPTLFGDERGYFYESYNKRYFEDAIGHQVLFVQDNQSFSKRGVLRGLHYQSGDHAQAKLVRVASGLVLDVVVDMRRGSPTFGNHFSIEISSENKKQLYVPRGFAHGFVTLSETAEFLYKCDNYYNKAADSGIFYNDPALGIDWKMPTASLIVSKKDSALPLLKHI